VNAAGLFDHLDRLSDHRGLFEHAEGIVRREEHGYCTDDNARLLVVTSRENDTGSPMPLSRVALDFVLDAQEVDGRCRNRMDISGRWTDRAGTDDCWGRSLWGLGVAASAHADASVRSRALRGFDVGVRQRSPWTRSMSFAAIGAAEILTSHPDHSSARALLVDAVATIGDVSTGSWTWPEPRLAYANAAVAEAVIAAGAALGRNADLERGLTMLEWLLDVETRDGHLSVTGVGGRGPGQQSPQFDQQPLEVAAMADACWRAYDVTGSRSWLRGVIASEAWFNGDNDAGLVMHDAEFGGGYDGLHPDRVNLNQGAESTLAFVSTMQRARSFATSR
jgi:hypothetical protein